ncbi:MAG: alpha/beta hydrolase-fold protein [Nannocystaceae bacterium]
MARLLAALALLLTACARPTAAPTAAPTAGAPAPAAASALAPAAQAPRIEHFSLRSDRLSAFAGRDVSFEAVVLTPAGYDPACGHPALYFVHGFGSGALRMAAAYAGSVLDRPRDDPAPPLLRVFLDANHPLGHHVFADSENTGPWSSALVDELLPAIEARYGAPAEADARFLSGHSSGGWASLWLQIDHPATFAGAWSLAPDPVDFRSFTNVDLYRATSMYVAADGTPTPLVRSGGEVVMTLEDFVREPEGREIFASFDAVFSPRGADGPLPLFDRASGRIDPEIARSWERYDVRARLQREWAALAPQLRGKLHVIVGDADDYYLDVPARLLAAELERLGSDASVLFVPGRGHADIFDPHPELYPAGLIASIEDAMWARFLATHPSTPLADGSACAPRSRG